MGYQMPAARPRAQQTPPCQQPIHPCLTLEPRLPRAGPGGAGEPCAWRPRLLPPCRAPEPPSAPGVAQAQTWGPAARRLAGSATGEGSELLALLSATTCPALSSFTDT